MGDDRARWDKRYHEERHLASLAPLPFLVTNADLVPRAGRALDVACGAGRNAIFLAGLGLRVTGIDISPEGLELARSSAKERGVELELVAADLLRFPIPRGAFAVVLVSHFLERALFPALEAALEPGGVLVYETFTRDQLAFPEAHPRREEFLLAPNELLRAFPTLRVLRYAETTQRLTDGRRCSLAQLVARRVPG
ncbi:MAG TPA: class I SAM-dependent methyltransferase [Planctomycetota bacterium]|nr:class I SAM-dependent methyltransferase [Planctomycetota bacterium]